MSRVTLYWANSPARRYRRLAPALQQIATLMQINAGPFRLPESSHEAAIRRAMAGVAPSRHRALASRRLGSPRGGRCGAARPGGRDRDKATASA